MIEETIKQIASIAWKGAANAHKNYSDNQHTFVKYWEGAEPQFDELKKQLLEQHEAEMVEFMNWRDKNYPRVLEVSENLLFLFKNRNK